MIRLQRPKKNKATEKTLVVNDCLNDVCDNVLEYQCLVIHIALGAHNNKIWCFDSGYSKHMTCDKSKFSHFQDYMDGFVTFGDGKKSIILGK